MTAELTQLLVREGRVEAERIEEALQRQILYGGQIDTVLLEMGLLDESLLQQYLARRHEMPAAGRAEIDAAGDRLLRLFPRRLAERYRVVPLWIDRRHLHVAFSRPVEPEVLDDIGFMLSLYLVPHITTEVRLQYALHRLYGAPMDARFTNLLAQIGEELEPNDAGEAVSLWVVDEPARTIPLSPSTEEVDESGGWQVVGIAEAELAVREFGFDAPAEAVSEFLTGRTSEAIDAADPDNPVARLLARLQANEDSIRQRVQRRHDRVAWGVEDAAAELTLARDRDDIVEVVLRFAFQNLDRVAFFTLLGDAFIGWDAIGSPLEEHVQTIRISLETPSALVEVRQSRVPRLGPLSPDDALLPHLDAPSPPPTALLWPLFIRNRLLGVLYGDRSGGAIPADTLSKLQLLAPRISTVFENLILQRKRSGEVVVSPDEAVPSAPSVPAPFDLAQATADSPLRSPREASSQPSDPVDDTAPVEFVEARLIGASTFDDAGIADTLPPEATTDAGSPVSQLAPPPPTDTQPEPESPGEPLRTPVAATLTPATRGPLVTSEESREAVQSQSAALKLLVRIGRTPVYPELLQLVRRAESFEDHDAKRHQAVDEIVRRGPTVLPALARCFPGTLRANLFGDFERRPSAAQLSAVCQALVRLGPTAAPIVVGALYSSERTHRLVGLTLLRELDIPAAFDGACVCLLDDEPRIAQAAAEYCTDGGHTPLPEGVSRQIEEQLTSSDPALVHRAIATTRACRDRTAIPKLIDIVDLAPKELAEEALDTLRDITKQDFGTNARKWRGWSKEHSSDRRLEWMLAGLSHKSRQVRQSAQEELNVLTGEYLGYHFDSPRTRREAAVGRWREWWELARQRSDLP